MFRIGRVGKAGPSDPEDFMIHTLQPVSHGSASALGSVKCNYIYFAIHIPVSPAHGLIYHLAAKYQSN